MKGDKRKKEKKKKKKRKKKGKRVVVGSGTPGGSNAYLESSVNIVGRPLFGNFLLKKLRYPQITMAMSTSNF
jgi:hypothetical protein